MGARTLHRNLNELLHYVPATGIIYRIKAAGRLKAGSRVGTLGVGGYRWVRLAEGNVLEHRLIWYLMMGEWPIVQLDHRNNIRCDNRWINLRLATSQQNNINRMVSERGSKGVFTSRDKYRAQIGRMYLGIFGTKFEAQLAYNNKAIELFGEYARLP